MAALGLPRDTAAVRTPTIAGPLAGAVAALVAPAAALLVVVRVSPPACLRQRTKHGRPAEAPWMKKNGGASPTTSNGDEPGPATRP